MIKNVLSQIMAIGAMLWVIILNLLLGKFVLQIWDDWQNGPDEWTIRLVFALFFSIYCGWIYAQWSFFFRGGEESKK